MSIRADLVNEVLHQMRSGATLWRALYDVRRSRDIFEIYWHALHPDAQMLLINHIEELRAKEIVKTS